MKRQVVMMGFPINQDTSMHTLSFEADIEGGAIRIPEAYRHLHKARVKVIFLTEGNASSGANFDPSWFFGVANQSKCEVDDDIEKSREGWR